jgi:hypothetical protein
MKILQFVVLLLASASVVNAEEIILSGGGGGAVVSCTSTADGVTLQYAPGSLVRTAEEGQKSGFVNTRDERRNKDVWTNSNIPDGTTIYIFGLAKDWGKMATRVDSVETSRALASGKVKNGTVTIRLPYRSKDGKTFNYAMLNGMGVLPNGTRGWSGVDGTQYSVDGPRGPYLLISKTCNPPSEAAIRMANALENNR